MSDAIRHTQKRFKNRQTVQVTVWVKPAVKAELQRLATRDGLTVSKTAGSFLEEAIRQSLHVQHAVLLQPIIETTLHREMRAYNNRLALLLVRCVFASEQTRSLATNILSRQPGVTQPVLEEILDGSSNAAKRNITRLTPQLETLLLEIKQWLQEEEKLHE